MSAQYAQVSAPDGARLARALNGYRITSPARSIGELAITLGPLALLWTMAWLVFCLGYMWATLLFAIPAAGFLVRLFMIQHDCGHGSFFRRRSTNDWVGRVIGVLTLTPYDYWRRTHAVHHATAGNLDRRGIGDIDTLTVAEYRGRSRWGRLRYRIYRHPLVMFGIGPAYLFLVQHRLPLGLMTAGWAPWISTMATNAAIAVLLIIAWWLIGLEALVLIGPDDAACGRGRRVAVLRPTSVRAHELGTRPRLVAACHRFAWKFTLRSARPLAMVDRKYWHPPCASSLQPHPILQVAYRSARSSVFKECRPIGIDR